MSGKKRFKMFGWLLAFAFWGSAAHSGVDIEHRVVICTAVECQELNPPSPFFLSIDGKEAEIGTDFVSAVTRNLWHPEWSLYTGGVASVMIFFTPDTRTRFRVSLDYTVSSTLTGSFGGSAYVYAGTDPPSQPQLSQYAPEFGTLSGSWSEIIEATPNHRIYINAISTAANGEGIRNDASIYNLIVTPVPAGDLNFDIDVDGSDLASFITAFIGQTPDADLDFNGLLDENDVVMFATKYGISG